MQKLVTMLVSLSVPVRRHPLLAFPVIYLGWAYLFWVPVLVSDGPVWQPPGLVWFLIGGASPLLAALLLTALDRGAAGVEDLFRRLVDWRRVPAGWWVGLVLFWPVFDLGMAALAILLDVSREPLDVRWDLALDPPALLFLLLLSFVFPAVEEVGLRGYYLDAVRQHRSLVTAGLLNGLVWALWHAPFVSFPGYYANTTFEPALSWWLPMIVCHGVMIAFVYERTRRSILAALVFHGAMNFSGEWLGLAAEVQPLVLVGCLAIALAILWSWRVAERR